MTRVQALALKHGDEVHVSPCRRAVGPKGGHTDLITRYRVTGAVRRWVTRPDAFRIPIMHGLYGPHAYITEGNIDAFHLPTECPLRDGV